MQFASDNTSPVHPKVMEAVMRANEGYASSYGNGSWFFPEFFWAAYKNEMYQFKKSIRTKGRYLMCKKRFYK